MRLLGLLLLSAVMMVSGYAFADTHDTVDVFGYELGKTHWVEVVDDGDIIGRHSGTGTTMLAMPVDRYEMRGLKRLTLFFGENDRLVGAVVGLDNQRFAQIEHVLRQKYEIEYEQLPTLGGRLVRFNAPDSKIEIASPYASFDMEARYMYGEFYEDFRLRRRNPPLNDPALDELF